MSQSERRIATRQSERVKARTRVYAATYEWDSDVGVYVVTFPAFPNLATQGTTLREARAMAAECLEIHIEGLLDRGIAVPAGERRTGVTTKFSREPMQHL